MPHDHRKKLVTTFIAAMLVTLLMAMPGSGFMVIFAILVLLIWIPIVVYAAIKKPEMRRLRAVQIALWIVAVSTIFTIHHFRGAAARQSADEIAAKVEEFSARTGHCPASLTEVGISESERKDRPGRPMYLCEEGRPFLAYSDTMSPFGRYSYDFKTRAWRFHD